jgi:hypothetical protein
VPNPGLQSNFWVRLPTTHLLEDVVSVAEGELRVQFKKSMETMWSTRYFYAVIETKRNTGVQQIIALPKHKVRFFYF